MKKHAWDTWNIYELHKNLKISFLNRNSVQTMLKSRMKTCSHFTITEKCSVAVTQFLINCTSRIYRINQLIFDDSNFCEFWIHQIKKSWMLTYSIKHKAKNGFQCGISSVYKFLLFVPKKMRQTSVLRILRNEYSEKDLPYYGICMQT